jgi:hypothetical protein
MKINQDDKLVLLFIASWIRGDAIISKKKTSNGTNGRPIDDIPQTFSTIVINKGGLMWIIKRDMNAVEFFIHSNMKTS